MLTIIVYTSGNIDRVSRARDLGKQDKSTSCFGSGRDSSVKPKRCSWCHKGGHTVESCWRRLGLCLLCGSSDHFMIECPSNSPKSPRKKSDPGRSQTNKTSPKPGKQTRVFKSRKSSSERRGQSPDPKSISSN